MYFKCVTEILIKETRTAVLKNLLCELPCALITPGYGLLTLSPASLKSGNRRVLYGEGFLIPSLNGREWDRQPISRKLKAICMRCQPSNQMFDVDWLPHPASWPNSSSFHPDVLETHTESLMKVVQHRGRGGNILVSCRGRSYLWFSPVGSHISSGFQSQTCSFPFIPSLRNHIWTLSSSLRLLRGCWRGVREVGSGGGGG